MYGWQVLSSTKTKLNIFPECVNNIITTRVKTRRFYQNDCQSAVPPDFY